MADKPIIALARGEWDARSLVLADQATGFEWDDISGFGTDLQPTGGNATYQAVGGVGTPWSDTLPAVKMDNQPANDQFGLSVAPGTVGNAFTFFAVAEATDLAGSGMAFWGSLDGEETPGGPRGIYLFITPLGEAGLIIGAPFVTYLRSAPGLVSPGDRVIITARRFDTPQNPPNTSGPCILRVNGVEVSSSSASGFVNFWFTERLHVCNLQSTFGFPGVIEGDDGLYAHLLQYASAASDEEILQMEAFLQEVWFDPIPVWVPSGPQFDFEAPVVPEKPTIINPEIEYDARTLPLILSDGDPVVTWADQSGNGNDAVDAAPPSDQPTLRFDRWAPGSGIPSVEFLDDGSGFPPDNEQEMGYDALVWGNTEMTIFIVAQIFDISDGCAFIGTLTGATPPREVDVCVFPDGTLFWGFGTETIPTAIQTNIISAPGVVKAGERFLVTVRSTGGSAGVDPEGMLIRYNGEQVASVPSFVTPPVASIQVGRIGRSQNTGSPELGLPGGTIHGVDRLIAWIGGYSVAATNLEILQMEAFLAETFDLDFLRKWTPQVPPSTAWTPS